MFTIPVLNVKADPLDGLLAAIGCRLAMLAKGDNEEFKQLLEDKNVTIQIGSKADNVARYYTFANGSVSQKIGKADEPDLSIDFQDSLTGVKLLTAGDVTALMSAIQDKQMTLEGDYRLLMWFSQLAKHIVPKVPDELKPYVEKAKPYAEKAKQTAEEIFTVIKQKLPK